VADAFGAPASRPTRQSTLYADREAAGFWHRVAAWLTDAFLTLAIGYGAGAAAATMMSDDQAAAVGVAAGVISWLLNVVVLVHVTGGRSVGKLLGGMRLVKDDGAPASAGTGFLRDVVLRLLYVSGLFFVLDSLWMLNDGSRTLRDKMAHTRVIREPSYRPTAILVSLSAVAALVAFGLAVEAGPESWRTDAPLTYTASDRAEFIAACAKNSRGRDDTPLCTCTYDWLSARLSYDQFQKLTFDGYGIPSVETNRMLDRAFTHCLRTL